MVRAVIRDDVVSTYVDTQAKLAQNVVLPVEVQNIWGVVGHTQCRLFCVEAISFH